MADNNVKSGLRCEKLDVGYGKKIVVSGVELVAEPGKILTLIGPNGSGKSTILKSITRQLKLLGGSVILNDQNLEKMSGSQIAKRMSMVMTERISPELMSCREVVATGRYPYVGRLGILSQEDWDKVDQAIELVHADEVAVKSFLEISDGQRQRVMLARALCQEPEVLILDEPTSFLDMHYKLDILGSIRKLVNDKGIAVIMSLHELELAMKVSDQVACVCGDRILMTGPPEDIFTKDNIQRLYEVEADSFNPLTGTLHLLGRREKPEVFVIGGGGSGIPVYYRLQRENRPFAAGIIMENDVEADVAKAGASRVVFTRPFHPISEKEIAEAKKLIDECEACICAVSEFAEYNRANQELAEYARLQGKIT